MRFPSRGRWLLWLILLFVLGPFVVIVPATLWLGWTMNPVQNFYLGTYAASSILSSYPGALTTVRYAEKTVPGRTPRPLLPEDAVKGASATQRLALSPKALAEGWRGVTITPPQKVRAKELRAYLASTIYDNVCEVNHLPFVRLFAFFRLHTPHVCTSNEVQGVVLYDSSLDLIAHGCGVRYLSHTIFHALDYLL